MRSTLISARAAPVLLVALLALLPQPTMSRSLNGTVGQEYFGNDYRWLMNPELLGFAKGDSAALAEVARLLSANDPRAALALQNYISRYPRDAAAFDLAGVELMRKQDTQKAIISFRKGLVLEPANVWLRAKLGAALIVDGQAELGATELKAALRLDPDNPLALRHLAQLAVQADDLPLALQYSQRALRVFGLPEGTVNQAHFDLAEIYSRLHRHRDTLDLLRPAVTNPDLSIPDHARLELYGRFLDAAMAKGKADDARLAYEALVPLVNPEDPRVMLTRARLLRLEGDTQGSLALIDDASAAHPDMATQFLPDRAATLNAAGRYTEAAVVWSGLAGQAHAGDEVPFLREALLAEIAAGDLEGAGDRALALGQEHADRFDLRMLAIEILGKTARTETALEEARKLTADFPDNAEAFRMLGVIAAASGDKAAGKTALERSLEIDPKQPLVWLTLAGVIHGHGSYVGSEGHGEGGHEDVEALLARAIEANPSDADLQSEIGLMYLSDGRVEEAIARFDEAVKNNPSHMAGLSLGALARADIDQDLQTAQAMIERASAMAPDEAINQDIMGWTLVRKGEIDSGLELLNAAAAAEPDDVTIQYHLGVAHQTAGNTDAAREHLLRALGGPNYTHNVADTRARYAALAPEPPVIVEMHRIDAGFEGQPIGRIVLDDIEGGVQFTGKLEDLPEGAYASHVHEYANCGAGASTPGSLAGAHYGHEMSGHDHGAMQAQAHDDAAKKLAEHDHAAMQTGGQDDGKDGGIIQVAEHEHAAMVADASALPVGDLQPFRVAPDGTSGTVFEHRRLALEDIRGRALMLHLGEDVDGKSGAKIACGVIP
ncbi:tetratricopeptide repeat protein [Sulfitobacter sp. LCG007]